MPTKESEARAALEERRLRSVYDFFDVPDYKKALQECDKIIKRHGTKMGPTITALRALALTKLGKHSEANKLLDGLLKEQPTEEATLAPMIIALRDIDRQCEVIPLYEAACKNAPTEELLNSLFMLYVRERDRTKAKTIALRLHKLTDKRPYYFTAVMHQYLSGKEAQDDRQRSMCFTLAEKMFDRMSPKADAELNLQYMIVRDSGKYADALKVMDSATNQLELLQQPEERWLLFQSLERWQDAADEAASRFERSGFADHVWLDRILELAPKTNQTVETLCEEVLRKMSEVKDADKRREIILNQIACLRRLGRIDDVEKTLLDFYRRFAEKIWCVPDIMFVLETMGDDRGKVMAALLPTIDKESYLYEKLRFEYGQLKDEEQLEVIQRFCTKYRSSGELERPSDHNADDSFLELASDIAVERFKKGDETSLKRIIAELDLAKDKSPNGFKLKLRLMWCYCAINDGFNVTEMAESLKIKYLQLESLGYMIGPFIGRFTLSYLEAFCHKIMALHTSSQKDIAEGIVNCYKCGSFQKIEEMEELKPRLENSFELANAKVLSALLAIMNKSRTVVVPTIAWDNLRDNSDMSVLPERYHFIFPSLESKIRELRVKWLVLRVLAAEAADVEARTAELKEFIEGAELGENNAFEYFVASLFADNSAGDLARRSDAVLSMKIESLATLRRFIHLTSELMMALACSFLMARTSELKKKVRCELNRLQKFEFDNALGHVFDSSVAVEEKISTHMKESYLSALSSLDKLMKD